MGFTETLTIIFILLKVFGVISWSWWLVWLPEIIAASFYLLIILFYVGAWVKIALKTRSLKKQSKTIRDNFKNTIKKFEEENKK